MFLSDREKKISKEYLNQGFVIQNVEEKNSLNWIRDCFHKIIKKEIPKTKTHDWSAHHVKSERPTPSEV